MEIIDGKVCISHEELTGRIITTSNLKALVRKGQVVQVQRGGNGRKALFDVNSLPLKWRTEVYRRYPDLQERAESKEFVDTIEPDAKALDFSRPTNWPTAGICPRTKCWSMRATPQL